MAFVNLSDQDLGLSLVHAVAGLNGWPIPRHDPLLDAPLDDDKDEDDADAAKAKSKKKAEKARLEAEKKRAEREARRKDIEQKRAAEAAVSAEIKKNAAYTKLLALADAKAWDELLPAVLTATPRMAQLSENESDLIYSLALALWPTAKNPASYLTKYIATVLQSNRKYPVASLKLLTFLFNTLNADPRAMALAPLRASTFTQLLKFALDTDSAKLLDGQLKHVEGWTKEWKLNATDSADLLLLVARVHQAAGQQGESQAYVLKHLQALDAADKKAIDAAKPTAYAAVVSALNSSTVYQFDTLLSLNTVKALQSDAKYDGAYALLSIFTTQTVEAFTKFAAEKKDFVAKAGLNADELLRKIRTLTLCTLGVEKDRWSFATLKQKLQLSDNNAVEASVLDAVISQCVEAKIDEACEEVIILRTTRRAFDSSGWKALAGQLAEWKKNVQSVLGALQVVQSRAPAAQDNIKS